MSTPTVLLLADSETEQLVARARRGGRRARRKLHRRLRAPLYPLAYAWSGHPWPATRAIRAAISAGLADGSRPYGSAVVAALHRHTSRPRDEQGAAASLLGLPTAAVAEHHRAGRAALGLPAEDSDVPRCAGWPLVSRDHAGLTPAERDAAKGHLRLCRRCRDGLVARRRTRAALQATGAVSGSGAVAAAAVAIEGMLASAGTATVAGGIGVVGGLGIVGGVNGGHLPAPLPFGGGHHSRYQCRQCRRCRRCRICTCSGDTDFTDLASLTARGRESRSYTCTGAAASEPATHTETDLDTPQRRVALHHAALAAADHLARRDGAAAAGAARAAVAVDLAATSHASFDQPAGSDPPPAVRLAATAVEERTVADVLARSAAYDQPAERHVALAPPELPLATATSAKAPAVLEPGCRSRILIRRVGGGNRRDRR
jgi:hypothetical protein